MHVLSLLIALSNVLALKLDGIVEVYGECNNVSPFARARCIPTLECEIKDKNSIHGVCKASVGTTCYDRLECVSGLKCVDNVCIKPQSKRGEKCEQDYWCPVGDVCKNETCTKIQVKIGTQVGITPL